MIENLKLCIIEVDSDNKERSSAYTRINAAFEFLIPMLQIKGNEKDIDMFFLFLCKILFLAFVEFCKKLNILEFDKKLLNCNTMQSFWRK